MKHKQNMGTYIHAPHCCTENWEGMHVTMLLSKALSGAPVLLYLYPGSKEALVQCLGLATPLAG